MCGNPSKARAKVGQLGVIANLLWASKAFSSNIVSFKNVAPAKLVTAQKTSCGKTCTSLALNQESWIPNGKKF